MTAILQAMVDFIWGLPLLGFIFIANIILVYHSRFLPLKGLVHAVKLLGEKKEETLLAEGQISHFQALCNAIAATVGLGNISGVAIAIATGGPGALFWMWIAALFGMNTKFFEVTVALFYRGRDYKGEVQGGAMYVIERALPRAYRPLAWMFAICGFCGTFSLFQINQLALYGETYYGLDKLAIGAVFSLLTGIVLLGGLKGISRFCEVVVPVMSVLYFMVVATILGLNIKLVPMVLATIFGEALNPSSAFGGIMGYGFLHILTTGTKRATFSNESGIGTAPMAHSNSRTSEPVSEGYVAMLGPFIDTIVVCSLTAFAILVTFPTGAPAGVSGIELTTLAFTSHMGIWGQHFLAISIMMFALSTMIGVANYNLKCWDYIFKGRWMLKDRAFIFVFCSSLLVGAVVPMDNVVNFMDIAFALMTIPNIFATVYLACKVKTELHIYNNKKKV